MAHASVRVVRELDATLACDKREHLGIDELGKPPAGRVVLQPALRALGVVAARCDEQGDEVGWEPAFVDEGVWIRPFGRLVYTMPPFITERKDIQTISQAIENVIRQHARP